MEPNVDIVVAVSSLRPCPSHPPAPPALPEWTERANGVLGTEFDFAVARAHQTEALPMKNAPNWEVESHKKKL